MNETDLAEWKRVIEFALTHWQALGLAGLVLPGFVAFLTYDLLIPSQRKSLGESTIELVTFGVVNALVALAIYQWSPLRIGVTESKGVAFFAVVGFVFVGPAALGAAVVWCRKRALLQRAFPHPTPSTWDFAFAEHPRALVLCHLKSGKRVGGVFAGNSFRTTYGEEHDIYLETQFLIDEKGAFVAPVPLSSGVLVRREECELVELYELKGKGNEGKPSGADEAQRGGTAGSDGAGSRELAGHPTAPR